MTRVLSWIAVQAAIIALTWLSFVEHRPWANNVFAFATVILTISAVVAAISRSDEKQKPGPLLKFRRVFSCGLFVAVSFTCAASGSFALATCWMLLAAIAIAPPVREGKPTGRTTRADLGEEIRVTIIK